MDIEKTVSRQRLEQIRNPDKHRARQQVARALRTGRLLQKQACDDCGGGPPVAAHHHNGYDAAHALDVIWLCHNCHGVRHRLDAPQEISPELRQIRRGLGLARMATLTEDGVKEFARLGGKARAAKMTKEQRLDHARKMVAARELKRKRSSSEAPSPALQSS